MNRVFRTAVIAVAAAFAFTPLEAQAITILSDSGANAAAIQDTVDAYRQLLGDPNNGNNPGSRREINWDGGGATEGTAPATPFTVFQNTRGATFTTPGIGLTQAPVSGGVQGRDLVDINATYAGLFAPFSPLRLFAPVGSNITEGFFSIPGTGGTVPATVRGFGAVFSDVDLENDTTLEIFDFKGRSLGVFAVPAATGNQTFSFLGVLMDLDELPIGSIRIDTGSAALGPNESATLDMVVMDDFLYDEPRPVPAPSTVVLLGIGLIAVAALSWAARSRSTS